jgi:hypothetical protein
MKTHRRASAIGWCESRRDRKRIVHGMAATRAATVINSLNSRCPNSVPRDARPPPFAPVFVGARPGGRIITTAPAAIRKIELPLTITWRLKTRMTCPARIEPAMKAAKRPGASVFEDTYYFDGAHYWHKWNERGSCRRQRGWRTENGLVRDQRLRLSSQIIRAHVVICQQSRAVLRTGLSTTYSTPGLIARARALGGSPPRKPRRLSKGRTSVHRVLESQLLTARDVAWGRGGSGRDMTRTDLGYPAFSRLLSVQLYSSS